MPEPEYRRCSVEGCAARHEARGLCKRHYRRWQRLHQPEVERRHDRTRRATPKRLAQERARNRKRRNYINVWIRSHRWANVTVIDNIDPVHVFDRDGHRCQICGRKPTGTFPADDCPTIDHIVPLSKGGDHVYTNVQTACFKCNRDKGDGTANDQLLLLG